MGGPLVPAELLRRFVSHQLRIKGERDIRLSSRSASLVSSSPAKRVSMGWPNRSRRGIAGCVRCEDQREAVRERVQAEALQLPRQSQPRIGGHA
jgi:hypothetical protein